MAYDIAEPVVTKGDIFFLEDPSSTLKTSA